MLGVVIHIALAIEERWMCSSLGRFPQYLTLSDKVRIGRLGVRVTEKSDNPAVKPEGVDICTG